MKQSPFLDGQMLIAMPGMGDPRFERSLIFLCAHSENGAMGIIVNKRAPRHYLFALLTNGLSRIQNRHGFFTHSSA